LVIEGKIIYSKNLEAIEPQEEVEAEEEIERLLIRNED
jgi:hypothetical protein